MPATSIPATLEGLCGIVSQHQEAVRAYLGQAQRELSVTPLLARFERKLADVRVAPKVVAYQPKRHQEEARQTEHLGNTPRPLRREELEELERRRYEYPGGEGKEPQIEPLDALEPKLRRLKLLANPGGGKSEYLKNLATRTTAQSLQALEDFTATTEAIVLPVFLRLEQISEALGADSLSHAERVRLLGPFLVERGCLKDPPANLTESGLFAAALLIALHAKEKLPLRLFPWLWRKLLPQSGTASSSPPPLLCLDALDEARVNRKALAAHLKAFAASSPARIFLTSRIVGYEPPWPADRAVDSDQELRIQPFTPEETREFVTHWFRKQPETGRQMLDELRQKIPIQGMAANPLMATLLCQAFSPLAGHAPLGFPFQRAAVYERVLRGLMGEWRLKKDNPERDQPTPEEQARLDARLGLLAQVALQLFAEGRERFSDRQLGAVIESCLQREADQALLADETLRLPEETLQRLQSLSARTRRAKLRKEVTGRLKSEFIESDGVLVRDSADENETWYGFLHLTFQEYLAARALAEEPAEIARRVRADHQKWWVMALLAGSKLVTHNDGSVWKLLKALCPQDCNDAARKQAADADYRLAWLAGEIVLENNLNAEGGTRSAEGRARHSVRAGRRAEDSPPYHEGEPLERIKSWLAALGDFQPFRARERALAGVVLGRLGDPRKGVGLFTEGPAKDLPEMDWIKIETPESGFIMGEHFDAPFHQKYHGGGRMQCHLLDLKSYYLSRYPVTVLQFAAFTKDKGYQIQDWWTDAGWRWKEKHVVTGTEQDRYYRGVLFTPNYPIVGVSWYEAVAYSRWLTYRLRFAQLMGDDEEIALPSEAQWERAARGLYGARYQWGDSAEDMYEKCNGCRIDSDSTSAVGIFPVDPQICEARDMTGNVQQWCRTKYATSYYEHYQPDDAIEGGDSRVVKGGSWECVRIVPPDMLSSARFSHVPSRRENDIGFRLVRAKFGPSH